MLHHDAAKLALFPEIKTQMDAWWNQSFCLPDGRFVYTGTCPVLALSGDTPIFWLMCADDHGLAEAWTSEDSTEIVTKLAELYRFIDLGWNLGEPRPATRRLSIDELWRDFGACLPGVRMAQRLLGRNFDLSEETISRAVIGGLPVGFLIGKIIDGVDGDDYQSAYADIGKRVIVGALRSVERISEHRFGLGIFDKLVAAAEDDDSEVFFATILKMIAQITPDRANFQHDDADRDYGVISSLASIARAMAWEDDRAIFTDALATAVSRGIACIYQRGDLESPNSPHIRPFIHALMDIAEKYELGAAIPN